MANTYAVGAHTAEIVIMIALAAPVVTGLLARLLVGMVIAWRR